MLNTYSVGILANGQAPFIYMPITQILPDKINGTTPMVNYSTTVRSSSNLLVDYRIDNCILLAYM